MSANSWRIPINWQDWMASVDKRIAGLERRPAVHAAADLLGPGIATYAVTVDDWNSDTAAFNGFFHSSVSSLNSPSAALGWLGQTITQHDGYGIQTLWPVHDITGAVINGLPYTRRFYIPGGQTPRIYQGWITDPVIAIRGTLTTPMTVPTGVWTTIDGWSTVDTIGTLDVGIRFVGAGVWSLDRGGWYRFELNTVFQSATGGSLRGGRFLLNGATVRGQTNHYATTANTSAPSSTELRAADGTTVAFQAYQDSGSSMSLPSLPEHCYYVIRRIAD